MATFGCAGYVYSQPAKTIRLPSGIDVYDLSGEWDALTESHDQTVSYGTNLQVIRITITGSFCPLTGQITSPVSVIGSKF
jgi:metal-sulfur cluster biosynthetic enzyme